MDLSEPEITHIRHDREERTPRGWRLIESLRCGRSPDGRAYVYDSGVSFWRGRGGFCKTCLRSHDAAVARRGS